MQLHNLKPQHNKKNIKRVARGGKRGTTAGRGTKGQRSRSGHKIRPAERDLFQRLPKKRGIKNPSFKERPIIIYFRDLEKIDGNLIDRETLIKTGLIKKNQEAKILNNGAPKKPLQIKDIKVSKSVKEKIEKSGGKII